MNGFLPLILSMTSFIMPMQKTSVTIGGVAKVELIQLDNTGKRHESYFFTFKVLEILEGNTPDSILTSQEIFHDFGGKQLFTKIYGNNGHKGEGVGKPIIIKFAPPQLGEEKYANNLNVKPNSLLLKEINGSLFFGDGQTPKVLVEAMFGSGRWIMATVDQDN